MARSAAPGCVGGDGVATAQRCALEAALVGDDRPPVTGHLGVALLEGLPLLGACAAGR